MWVPCCDGGGVFAGEDGADGLKVDGAVGGDGQCGGQLGLGSAGGGHGPCQFNYDTGLTADGDCTRTRFEDAVVQRELKIIATDLHATAVRVSGDDPQRLARAGQHALGAGLELWFSPVPVNLEPGALPGYLARCASQAERLRRDHEGQMVLVLGCEISLWCAGFFPGGDSVLGRLAAVTDPDLQRKPDMDDHRRETRPPVIPGIYQRDEEEQVRHLHDMLAIYEAEDLDSAFWFTFAGFEQPRHPTDPHRDLDLASYGAVAHTHGTTYPDMAWEPKQVFGALAAAYARARPTPRPAPSNAVPSAIQDRSRPHDRPSPLGKISYLARSRAVVTDARFHCRARRQPALDQRRWQAGAVLPVPHPGRAPVRRAAGVPARGGWRCCPAAG